MPVMAAILLLVGATWSVVSRKLWPLVLAEATVLAVVALVDAAVYEPDFGTGVLLMVRGSSAGVRYAINPAAAIRRCRGR